MILHASINENSELKKEVISLIEKYIANYTEEAVNKKVDDFLSEKLEKFNKLLDEHFSEFNINFHAKLKQYVDFTKEDFVKLIIKNYLQDYFNEEMKKESLKNSFNSLLIPLTKEIVNEKTNKTLEEMIIDILCTNPMSIEFGFKK